MPVSVHGVPLGVPDLRPAIPNLLAFSLVPVAAGCFVRLIAPRRRAELCCLGAHADERGVHAGAAGRPVPGRSYLVARR